MTICIAGKNNIAINVCRYIIAKHPDIHLLAIHNKTDNGQDSWQPSFRKFCLDNNLPLVSLQEAYNIPDLIFISLEFDSIINPKLFTTTEIFNIHFSLLPEYKGMYTSALPILHGKSHTGVTFHKIDAGIDTGDIIAQEQFEISQQETARTLYHKYLEHGTALVISLLDNIITHSYSATPQPATGSTYYSKKAIDYSKLLIDTRVTASQLDAQVRAFSFREYQLPQLNNHRVHHIEITTNKSFLRPGTITRQMPHCHTQATIDYDATIYYDQLDDILLYCRENNLDALSKVPQLEKYLEDQETEHGWTPLIVAAYHHSTDVCAYLLAKGANVNASNYKGTTVLMYAKDAALAASDFSYLDLFLSHGADRHARDNSGLSLADYLRGQSLELKDYLNI